MAQLKGPIQFTGSLGNIRSYYNKHLKCYTVSTKGGATKEQINNSPSFARTRENMSEFKACGKWASQLRRSLLSIAHLHQGYYFGEIVALAKIIQKRDDDHPRGHRSIESSKAAWLLQNLNFNRDHPFDQVLSNQIEVSFSEDKKTVTFKTLGFKSFSRLNWPNGYDWFRVVLVIAQIPDHEWNEKENCYKPLYMNMEQLAVSTFSEWFPRSTEPRDIIQSASFAHPALQQPGTTVIVAVGVEVISSAMGSSAMNSTGSGTMKIVQCFV